jgi:RHS repeat-associated protein
VKWRVAYTAPTQGHPAIPIATTACSNSLTQQHKLGQYHCWNRELDLQTGRWTTPDPAASPWANLQSYAENDPTCTSDPVGLQPADDLDELRAESKRKRGANGLYMKWKTKPTATGPCGGSKMEIEWQLDTQEDGWIVQYVFRQIDTYYCNNSQKDYRTQSYWEAWRVVGGVIYKGYVTGGVGSLDQFTLDDAYNSRGTYSILGYAKFIANINYVRDYFKGNPVRNAGILPSSDKHPEGFKNLVGRRHEMDVTWDCCCHPWKPTEVTGSIDAEKTSWADVWE